MNKVFIEGRLTADPELRYTQTNNIAIAKFTIAVNKHLKSDSDKNTAEFIRCLAWNKTAENLCNLTGKGKRVLVEGRIENSSYDKEDGTKGYMTYVVAERINIIDFKNKETSVENDPFEDFGDSVIADDDLPF